MLNIFDLHLGAQIQKSIQKEKPNKIIFVWFPLIIYCVKLIVLMYQLRMNVFPSQNILNLNLHAQTCILKYTLLA